MTIAIDLTPLRSSVAFRVLWLGQLAAQFARQTLAVAIPFQVFSATRSTVLVGLLGVAQVLPLIAGSLLGGVIADRIDRRRLLQVTNAGAAACVCVTAFGLATVRGTAQLVLLFVVVAALAGLGAVDQPARTATAATVVPRQLLPAAQALQVGLMQTSVLAGPALGGLLIAHYGVVAACEASLCCSLAAVLAMVFLPAQPLARASSGSLAHALREGLGHLRRQRAVVGGLLLDLDAMVVGSPRALFPTLALGTFHAGPGGLGLLYAAPGLGALLAVLTTGWTSRTRALGRPVVMAVVVWGLATAVLGLAHDLWLAIVVMVVAGIADGVSAVCRNTVTQLSTPDAVRGRISSVSSLVVMGGPYLGDLRAGCLGALLPPPAAVLFSGLACAALAVASRTAAPALWRFRTDQVPGAPT